MSKLQSVRGTQDLLPEVCRGFRKIDELAFQIASLYGFEEISTPIFEFSEVFHRTLGESSDMVSKETYTFQDRGGDSLTLRPEGTAGIARAFISNGMAQNLPLKLYYSGPMFRYERPQKGRYRQFHQIGVEYLGIDSPSADIECLALAYDLLCRIGLKDKVQLQINSLGDPESRQKHRDQLVTYLQPFANQLSPDSQTRLQKNPLRILDSKDPADQKIIAGAPSLESCLNQTSKDFFAKVLSGLEALKIPYQINQQLVRGIDYYTHTVFEFVTSELGAQGAVLAGGRYDGLIELMGGPRTPGVGWASGMERLALLLDPKSLETHHKKIMVIAADEQAENKCFELAHQLRSHNFPQGFMVEIPLSGNVGKKMKKANKWGAHYALIVGETELQSQSVTVKNLQSGEQALVSEKNLLDFLTKP
ncbi:MAG: histidine--tRNA ligase [Bdellovibrio sp. CG10_big_fil_rev_8_21_14_0_10_47_8]|nr:MAG: histidine--tRNA ligase [Bdellovibrio sp. CG10_big_fil_rev_8_21_14_0_10_47_8]